MMKNRLHKTLFLPAILVFALFITTCEQEEEITGANRMEELQAEETGILADGVSTMALFATVYDTSGVPADGQRVNFSATRGSITPYAITDGSGTATAILTSEASQTDIEAVVHATVLDSGSVKKSTGVKNFLMLSADKKHDKKAGDLKPNEAEITVSFFGVTKKTELKDSTLTADGGRSSALLRVVVKETSSRKAVNGAGFSLSSVYNTLPGEFKTDAYGTAEINIPSITKAATDTLVLQYGAFEPDTFHVEYILPKLDLKPDQAQVNADGLSTLQLSAHLISHTNNPVTGGEITFIATDGIITKTAITNDMGVASAKLTSSDKVNNNVKVIASFNDVRDTTKVEFVDEAVSQEMSIEGPQQLIRNGVSGGEVKVTLEDNYGNAITDTKVRFSALYGEIDSVATTDDSGIATAEYTPDADSVSVDEMIYVTSGSNSKSWPIRLFGVHMQVETVPDSITADGSTTAKVNVTLKSDDKGMAISNAPVSFSASLGSITPVVTTDDRGFASSELRSSTEAGVSKIVVRYGLIEKEVKVKFTTANPASIILSASPQYIWVKETGNIEQTTVQATVLSQTGEPVGSNTKVEFLIRNGTAGGGESISPPAAGNEKRTTPISTVNGVAKATMRSGIRSGTIEVEARVVNVPDIVARTTKIVIRSGPPYIWIDPDDTHHVEPHMTLTLDRFNLNGWNVVQTFNPGIYIGDKYNNPVEVGTSVYLTSTAGIITTDVSTDAEGKAGAKLQTANPRPYVEPSDPTALAPHRIPNPNMDESDPDHFLPIEDLVPEIIRDFDKYNPHGVVGENDGIAYIFATTHGKDQNGDDAVVWTLAPVVFSGPLAFFDVTTNADTLKSGAAAQITIEVLDINGNPVAAGSKLTAKASDGQLSNEQLMPEADRYSYGSTLFHTYLLNNLKPGEDESTMAEVTVELDSPNGKASGTVYIYLKLPPG